MPSEQSKYREMKILFVSHLSSGVSAGLNWSVPASVKAQEKIDEVLWIDMTPGAYQKHWGQCVSYHNFKEFKCIDYNNLPIIGRPDIVIFEGFYFFQDVVISWRLQRLHIPYVIVPRSGLTKQGLNNHSKVKKKIANFIFFNRFVRKAAAIQFLTEDERSDSINICSNSFIVPNGFDTPQVCKERFNTNCIKAIFIGRLDFHQKGLDILLNACRELKSLMKSKNFTIEIYGPRRLDYQKILEYVDENNLEEVVFPKDVIAGKSKEYALMNSDLFVMTSRYEGHPMGLIEALAYGLPVFITKGSNMKKEVDEFDAGWTCETNEGQVIATLRCILESNNEFARKGENARRLSLKYDWGVLAEQLHDNLEMILKNINDSKCQH